MSVAAWPVVTGVAVVAAGVVAIAPVAPPLSDVAIPGPHLTSTESFLDALQAGELGFNEGLVNTELGFNHGLVGLESLLLGAGADQDDVLNRLLDGTLNMRVDSIEGLANGLIGAHAESSAAGDGTAGVSQLTQSLVLGDPNAVFNTGDIGGAGAVRDQQDAMLSLLIGNPTHQDLLTTYAGQVADAVDNQAAFTLLGGELTGSGGLEQEILSLLSGDSAVTNGIERLFNAGNMGLETLVGSLFGLAGTSPFEVASYADGGVSQLTSALLLDPDEVFNGGDIGGLEDVFDQDLVAFLDFAEIGFSGLSDSGTSALDPGDLVSLSGI